MKPWTKGEEDILKRYCNDNHNMSIGDMAEGLGRSYDSVEHKIRKLGLQDWQEEKEGVIKVIKKNEPELIKLIGQEIVKQFKPVKLESYIPSKSKKKNEEFSILDLSDIHIGMINKVFDSNTGKEEITYNHEIFKHQMEMFINGIGEIYILLSSGYLLKTLYINSLGDIITNDRIFPEQPFEIEKAVGLQVWDAVNYLIYFINKMKCYYENIIFTGIVGNHGRSQPDLYNEPVQNNFEYFIYRVLEKQFADDDRVEIIVPETRRFIVEIAGHKHLLEHGDSFRGTTENYIEQQVKNLFVNVGNFEVLDFGHFHKLKERELSDKVIVKQNGCWISKDNYAFKMFKDYSIPKQWLYGCNEKRSTTWGFKLDFLS